MRVIVKGAPWSIKQVCTGSGNGGGGCHSILRVEEQDIYFTTHTDMSGETDYYYTFCCPVCGKETDICPILIPSSVKDHVSDKRSGYTRSRSWR